MLAPELLTLLQCPTCKGELVALQAGAQCRGCQRTYPAGRGYLDLLDDTRVDESLEAHRPWVVRVYERPWCVRTYDCWRVTYLKLMGIPRFDFQSECTLLKGFLGFDAGPGPMVDLSCGATFHAIELARLWPGRPILGLDISAVMLDEAVTRVRRAGVANVYLLRADAHNLPFGNGVLSGVSNQGALHLYSDPKQVLREVFRVLVSGGPYVATVEVRSRRRLPLLLQKLLRWGREPFWEEHVFRDLLERTGFTGYERMLLAHLLLFRVVRP